MYVYEKYDPEEGIADYHGPQFDDDRLRALIGLFDIRVLILGQTSVGDAGIRYLSGNESLVEIGIASDVITDESMAVFGTLHNLRSLCLTASRVSDAGLNHIKSIPHLRELYISASQISDAGLGHLGSHKHLWSLNISQTNITDRGVEHLSGLASLSSFDADDTQISGIGCRCLRDNSAFHLSLDRCPITNDGLEAIVTALPSITWLSLSGTGLDDDGMAIIARLDKLEALRINDTKVTRYGLKQLSDLPQLQELQFQGRALWKDDLRAALQSPSRRRAEAAPGKSGCAEHPLIRLRGLRAQLARLACIALAVRGCLRLLPEAYGIQPPPGMNRPLNRFREVIRTCQRVCTCQLVIDDPNDLLSAIKQAEPQLRECLEAHVRQYSDWEEGWHAWPLLILAVQALAESTLGIDEGDPSENVAVGAAELGWIPRAQQSALADAEYLIGAGLVKESHQEQAIPQEFFERGLWVGGDKTE